MLNQKTKSRAVLISFLLVLVLCLTMIPSTVNAGNNHDGNDSEKKGSITVEKKDEECEKGPVCKHRGDHEYEELEGAVFRLQYWDDREDEWKDVKRNSKFVEKTTDDDGEATFSYLELNKKYRIIEIKAPDGYDIGSIKIDDCGIFKPTNNDKHEDLDATNKKLQYGEAVVFKKDKDSKKLLEGAVFKLQTLIDREWKDVLDSQRGKVTSTTDEYGKAVFTKLLLNKEYRIIEIRAPKGYDPNYIKIDNKGKFKLDKHNKKVTLYAYNKKAVGDIELKKIDGDEGEILEEVVFVLYKKGLPVENSERETDYEGEVEWEGLPYGEYTIVEKTALEDYDGVLSLYDEDKNLIPDNKVTIDSRNKDLELLGKNFKHKGKATLTKLDSETDKAISGAGFFLLKGTNFVPGSERITDKDGQVIWENLAPGTYKVVESKAAYGYMADTLEIYINNLISEKKEFIIDDGTTPSNIYMVGKNDPMKGSVELLKYNLHSDVKNPISGASFYLENEAGTTYSAISNSKGVAIWDGLAWGTYTIHEDKAAPGYDKDSFSLEGDTIIIDAFNGVYESIKLVGENERLPGTLEILMLDAGTLDPLSGAIFSLQYDPDGDGVFEVYKDSEGKTITATTGADGLATFAGLAWGKYHVIEDTAAEGYDKGTLEFKNKTNEFAINAEVIDEKLIALNKKTEVMDEEAFPENEDGNVLGDEYKQKVLGEESKTDDLMNIALMIYLILTALAITGGIFAQRRSSSK